jgi:glycosyltransferase involved in cell wall biosynthesis
MRTPLVSVCLPSLNTLPFLKERIDTIFGQTFRDWELVVTDGYSDDGSWEFFERLAGLEGRVSIAQAPRGLYSGWNHCLRRARGQYVYVATSDDAMALDCLEKMVTALDAHGDCDLAHCPLVMTTQDGQTLTRKPHRWPDCTVFAHGIEDVARRPHVRRAPYDGLLHLTGRHVILSVNQLLIRRSLFARTGYFLSDWGSVGDFNWEMRAGLLASTVHVPDTWASLRVHPAQVSASVDPFGPEWAREIDAMIEDAVAACGPLMRPDVVEGLRSGWLGLSREMRRYYAGLRERRRVAGRRLFQAIQFLVGGTAVRSEMLARARGAARWPDAAPGEIRVWLEGLTGRPMIEAPPRGL